MRLFPILSTLSFVAVLLVLGAIPATATQGNRLGYDLEFSEFLQIQGANIQPSVVFIETRFTRIVHDPAGVEREIIVEGDMASGFFYNRDGIVVTEYTAIRHAPSTYFARTSGHPASEADYILVRLLNGQQYEAEIVGLDPATSLAVLRCINISPEYSIPIPIGDSNDVIVGEPILLVAYNFLSRRRISYDFGIISALRPKFASIDESTNQYFQVNVPKNPGNQGGVIVNTEGGVIAVMTNIAPYSDTTEVHFGLPIETVVEVVDAILDEGSMHRPWFGYRLLEMNPQIERAYEIIHDMSGDGLVTDIDRDLFEAENGIDLTECLFTIFISEDSPAEDAGIREGDILTKFNGMPVGTMDDLLNEIEKYRIGDRVTLEWMRREYTVWDPYIAEIEIEYGGQRDEDEEVYLFETSE